MALYNSLMWIIIWLVIPLIGIMQYLKIRKVMIAQKINPMPEFQVFFTFGTYGLLLNILLISLFWPTSGMNHMIYFPPLFFGTPIMTIFALKSFSSRKNSKIQGVLFKLAAGYFLAMVAVLVISIIVVDLYH